MLVMASGASAENAPVTSHYLFTVTRGIYSSRVGGGGAAADRRATGAAGALPTVLKMSAGQPPKQNKKVQQ